MESQEGKAEGYDCRQEPATIYRPLGAVLPVGQKARATRLYSSPNPFSGVNCVYCIDPHLYYERADGRAESTNLLWVFVGFGLMGPGSTNIEAPDGTVLYRGDKTNGWIPPEDALTAIGITPIGEPWKNEPKEVKSEMPTGNDCTCDMCQPKEECCAGDYPDVSTNEQGPEQPEVAFHIKRAKQAAEAVNAFYADLAVGPVQDHRFMLTLEYLKQYKLK